jgi:hypothetical protein
LKNTILLFVPVIFFAMEAAAEVRTSTDRDKVCDSKGTCYQISYDGHPQGMVKKFKAGETTGALMPDTQDFKSVIMFKDRLYARRKDDKKVFAWIEDKKVWVEIAKNVEKLQTDEQELFVITTDHKLGRYDGSDFTYETWPHIDLSWTFLRKGRDVFYYPDSISNVERMQTSSHGKTQIKHTDEVVEDLDKESEIRSLVDQGRI